MTKDIENYEGLYSINELGEIFSYPKKTIKGFRKLKPVLYSNGYMIVDLCKDGIRKKKLVHRLVANAFLNNPLNKPQVNHINGNKTDNRLENLEWNTVSENQKHSIKIGLRSAKGTKNSQSKLSEEIVIKILNDKRKYIEISKEYSISIPTISNIKTGHTWTHITRMV